MKIIVKQIEMGIKRELERDFNVILRGIEKAIRREFERNLKGGLKGNLSEISMWF